MSHPNNIANFNSVGEKSVILHSLWFGGTWYIYIMGVSQLNILNSWIRIQLMNLDLNVQFIPQKITALPLAIHLFLVKTTVFDWLFLFSTMVANKPRWRADGDTHRRNIVNLGRMWLTMKNHNNMHNLLPLYYCDRGKDFTAFSHSRLVAIRTFRTVRPVPSRRALQPCSRP